MRPYARSGLVSVLLFLAGCADGSEGSCDHEACNDGCVAAGYPSGVCSSGDCECLGGTDGDADNDADRGCDNIGVMLDPTSMLCWQNPPDGARSWEEAMIYCNTLSLSGYGRGSWQLPTISELRSLIRGCPGTETNGACDVIDSCLADACRNDSCVGCLDLSGPGARGAYWPEGFGGPVDWYWSSSSDATSPFLAWYISFDNGHLGAGDKTEMSFVRCVRRGP